MEFKVQGSRFKVGGRIDRIDVMDGRLRIVDYKTGAYRLTDKVKMENVVGLAGTHEPLAPKRSEERYYLQTFLYALAEMQHPEATLPIQPVLFFPIKAGQEDYDPSLKIDGEPVLDFARQHAEAFREGLEAILADIFDPARPFTCTRDVKTCTYCKLGLLCGKKNR